MRLINPTGPANPRILIVADFPSVEAERKGIPLAGTEAALLSEMLHEVGLLYSEVRIAYLCAFRPYASKMRYAWTLDKAEAKQIPQAVYLKGAYCSPEFIDSAQELEREIRRVQPNLIIALGDAPLHWLTGMESVSKWRGSLLTYSGIKLIPTYSPAQIMRMWEWRPLAVRDLQRCVALSQTPEFPQVDYDFIIHPDYPEALRLLRSVIVRLNTTKTKLPISVDIETINRHIACIGFALTSRSAFCIPFMDKTGASFYTLEEEAEVVWLTRTILLHPMTDLVGQNHAYDIQHYVRSWGFRPRIGFDTMLANHICFPGTPKDLGMLASLYCEHYVYWKDELTDYKKMPEDVNKFWLYNCKDCANTFEISEVLRKVVTHLGFTEQFDFLQNLNHHVITMMIRGVRIDRTMKDKLTLELIDALADRTDEIHALLGFPLNIDSPKQMQNLFYTEMGLKPVMNKKTYRPTTDEKALIELAQREPLLRPLTNLISETRSVGVFLSTFLQMPLDHDQRMRCSFNVGGAETFRFSSSKDAFGSGGNLQNIPKGNEEEELAPTAFVFPNVRRLFQPDPGFTLFDVDLAGADAQVVAWEANDDDLKAKFRAGVKIHAENAKDIYGRDAGPDGKRKPYYAKAKMGCHLTNYGGKPRTLSKALGMTIKEAEWFQDRWFSMHPGIQTWHEEVENSLQTTRSVRNKFGFRRFYFDRIEGLLPEALAWIPQSTVAIVINKGLVRIAESQTELELFLQVHDSLVGQFPTHLQRKLLPVLHDCLRIPVPYSDPLIIGTSLDLSQKSWGDLVEMKWKDVFDN